MDVRYSQSRFLKRNKYTFLNYQNGPWIGGNTRCTIVGSRNTTWKRQVLSAIFLDGRMSLLTPNRQCRVDQYGPSVNGALVDKLGRPARCRSCVDVIQWGTSVIPQMMRTRSWSGFQKKFVWQMMWKDIHNFSRTTVEFIDLDISGYVWIHLWCWLYGVPFHTWHIHNLLPDRDDPSHPVSKCIGPGRPQKRLSRLCQTHCLCGGMKPEQKRKTQTAEIWTWFSASHPKAIDERGRNAIHINVFSKRIYNFKIDLARR